MNRKSTNATAANCKKATHHPPPVIHPGRTRINVVGAVLGGGCMGKGTGPAKCTRAGAGEPLGVGTNQNLGKHGVTGGSGEAHGIPRLPLAGRRRLFNLNTWQFWESGKGKGNGRHNKGGSLGGESALPGPGRQAWENNVWEQQEPGGGRTGRYFR